MMVMIPPIVAIMQLQKQQEEEKKKRKQKEREHKMTNGKLHDILDDKNKKISLKDCKEILWELKEDCFYEISKLNITDNKTQFYYGEINAFYIALDLIEHIIGDDEA